jgi:ZU5 domain
MLGNDGKRTMWGCAGVLAAVLLAGCDGGGDGGAPGSDRLRATIGADGGELVGQAGTALAGVRLTIPPGALTAMTEIEIQPAGDETPLPATAVRCGPMFAILPAGLPLVSPATLTLPYDETMVADQNRFGDEVKVWVKNGNAWGQRLQTDSSAGSVTIQLDALQTAAAGVNPPVPSDVVSFQFAPNPKFVRCLAQYPDDPARAPHVEATVVRGELNDGLFLKGKYIKPELAFDLFTVQNGALDAAGVPVVGFGGFGLAWYQTDLQAKDNGSMKVQIRTILLDQIFGFDPAFLLPPTGTFEVGFWFNDPNAAVACGFDASAPTPFNGEHRAGPLAMITLPDATTGLGPLCTNPDTSVTPARCSP